MLAATNVLADIFAQVNWLCGCNLICFNGIHNTEIEIENEKLDILNMIDDVLFFIHVDRLSCYTVN